jgi:FlaA1/EpsC-like NDP-sugar epimerase
LHNVLAELRAANLAAIATGRTDSIFKADYEEHQDDLTRLYRGSSILVVGGAGSIGSAVVHLLLELQPKRLAVLDNNENALTALTREIRGLDADVSHIELHFLPVDFGAWPGLYFLQGGPRFDFVLNFAAVKHVRSEKDLYSILHMLDTNVVKQWRFLQALARAQPSCRYFVVSTDKAADPGNFMGATKRLLELVAFHPPDVVASAWRVSSARFANVAFSNGSLLESFVTRFRARAPLAAPRNTQRYFISSREAAEICLLGQLYCPNGTIAIPRLHALNRAVDLASVAARFVEEMGRKPVFVETLYDARRMLQQDARSGTSYPILLTPRDTSGEKEIEIFAAASEQLVELGLKALIGVIPAPADHTFPEVLLELASMTQGTKKVSSIDEIMTTMQAAVPNFKHVGGSQTLDSRF